MMEAFMKPITEFIEKLLNRQRGSLPEVRYGTVINATGRPTVQFDGEIVASGRRYPYLGSYTPVIGDRVQLIRGESGTWVVQGKIV